MQPAERCEDMVLCRGAHEVLKSRGSGDTTAVDSKEAYEIAVCCASPGSGSIDRETRRMDTSRGELSQRRSVYTERWWRTGIFRKLCLSEGCCDVLFGGINPPDGKKLRLRHELEAKEAVLFSQIAAPWSWSQRKKVGSGESVFVEWWCHLARL